jgi:hypothetical protein
MNPAPPVKSILSKWSIIVLLLIGFFTFSGSAASTFTKTSNTPTTLVVTTKARIGKTICFHVPTGANKPVSDSYLTASILIDNLICKQLVAVSLKIHNGTIIIKLTIFSLYSARSVTQNGPDEPAIS